MTARFPTPALDAWRRRGDVSALDSLWRQACWQAAARERGGGHAGQAAAHALGVSHVIREDGDYYPGDEDGRTLRDGSRVPGPMERRGRVCQARFRELMAATRKVVREGLAQAGEPAAVLAKKPQTTAGWSKPMRGTW